MSELPNVPTPDPHMPSSKGLQIGDHRLSLSCGVVERPGLINILVMTLFYPVTTALILHLDKEVK